MVIKYKVEKMFKDKNTKEIVKANSVIDVDITRMKELNEKKVGRTIDIIVDGEIKTQNNNDETQLEPLENNNIESTRVDGDKKKISYTVEELEVMTVNELKDLAEKIGCELKQAKKDEIIKEIVEFSNN